MKKVFEFLKNYGGLILAAFAIVALILSFLLPLLIGIGRYFWHMALISPSVFG